MLRAFQIPLYILTKLVWLNLIRNLKKMRFCGQITSMALNLKKIVQKFISVISNYKAPNTKYETV